MWELTFQLWFSTVYQKKNATEGQDKNPLCVNISSRRRIGGMETKLHDPAVLSSEKHSLATIAKEADWVLEAVPIPTEKWTPFLQPIPSHYTY